MAVKRRQILGMLFLISVVTYIDRVNISVAGKEMMRVFGLSAVQIGTVFSAFVFGYDFTNADSVHR